MAEEDSGEEREVVVFHGSEDQVKFDSLKVDGPDSSKPFFVSRDKTTAENATAGHPERVLRYIIPKSKASEILGEEGRYGGMLTSHDSTEFKVEGEERIKLLHQYLDPRQRVSAY
jgi:hypothetical protein